MTDIKEELVFFKRPKDLFTYNHHAIDFDFDLLTKGRTSQELSSTNGFLGDKKDLFIEEGAYVEFSTINTKTGRFTSGKILRSWKVAIFVGRLHFVMIPNLILAQNLWSNHHWSSL
jgi:hypothetical protein